MASRTDAVASWGERAAKLVLWVVGPSTILAAVLGGLGWLWSNPLYGALIGLAAFALTQLGLTLWAIRRSAARRGPFAEPQPEGVVPAALSQTDPEDVEQLRIERAEHQQLRGEVESLTGQKDKLQEEVNSRDADRDMYWGLLVDALKEGLELRESNPSKEDAQEWASYLHKLLEAAEGEWRVKPFRRPTPGYAYADLDATGEQAFMDYELSKLQELIQLVQSRQIIKFRSSFDPHEWKDWKSPPSTSPAATESHQIPEHMISERHIRYHETPIPLVDLLEVAGDNSVLRDFQFDHCILVGPGVINLQGPYPKPEHGEPQAALSVGPTDCRVEGSPDTALYQIGRDGKMPVGVIHLSGYTLKAVTFRGLGFAGTPEHLERLKDQLIFSEGNHTPASDSANKEHAQNRQERRQRIDEWRSVIHDFDTDRFAGTDTYSQMKPHLRPEVIKMLEAPRTFPVGNEARGDTAYRYTLLDEVARIEQEWGVI